MSAGNGLTKLTNCRLLVGGALVREDLWMSSATGKIIRSQAAFYDELVLPDETVDLGRPHRLARLHRTASLNGAFGFNFSTLFDDMAQYGKKLRDLNRKLVATGVTSYIPTVTSQTSELYHKVSPPASQVPGGQVPSPPATDRNRSSPFWGRPATCSALKTAPSRWAPTLRARF